MRRSCFVRSFLALAMMSAVSWSVAAQERFALVIGNGAYTSVSKLKNPVNDATDMAAALKSIGFQVELLADSNLQDMESAVVRLGNKLSQSPGSYGFFFYSGHGVQSNGTNYLIPADANIASEAFLRTKALAAQDVLDTLLMAKNDLNVVVLDACRDNPFGWTRSGARGLAVVGIQPSGSIIVYSTSAGSVAQDGEGRNGLFTSRLLKNITTPGLEIKDVFNRTGADVVTSSSNQQVPAVYNQYFKLAYLAGGASQTASSSAPETRPQFGAVTVTPGNVVVSSVSAGSLSFQNKTIKLPANGTLPVGNVAPGDYWGTMTYADGSTETQAAHVLAGSTVKVSFTGAPKPVQAVSVGPGWKNYTRDNGLGGDWVNGVAVSSSTICVATDGGLAISTDKGVKWKLCTTDNGLGDNQIKCVAVFGSTIYAGTYEGLSVSTDKGAHWSNYTPTEGPGYDRLVAAIAVSGKTIYTGSTGRGLSISTDRGNTWRNYNSDNGFKAGVYDIAVSGSTIYAATSGGLAISTDKGVSWKIYTTADGLAYDWLNGVAVSGSTIYAATEDGLSISKTGGARWRNYTTANGLGSNNVKKVAVSGSTIYAATGGGLSISTNGGASWKNYTSASGLASDSVEGVAVSGSTIYAATEGGLSILTGALK